MRPRILSLPILALLGIVSLWSQPVLAQGSPSPSAPYANPEEQRVIKLYRAKSTAFDKRCDVPQLMAYLDAMDADSARLKKMRDDALASRRSLDSNGKARVFALATDTRKAQKWLSQWDDRVKNNCHPARLFKAIMRDLEACKPADAEKNWLE